MATRQIPLPAGLFIPLNGSAGNLPAGAIAPQSTGADTPAPRWPGHAFDDSQLESVCATFDVPEYDSAAKFTLKWYSAAGAGAFVRWRAKLVKKTANNGEIITSANNADDVTVLDATATANSLQSIELDLSSDDNGLAADDTAMLIISRDGADGDDTAGNDAYFIGGTFSYDDGS